MRVVEVEFRIPEHGVSNAIKAINEMILSGLYIVEAFYSRMFAPHELSLKVKTAYLETPPEKFISSVKRKYTRVKAILKKHNVPFRLHRVTASLEDKLSEAEKLVLDDMVSKTVAEVFSEEPETTELVTS